jgi:hypothetical protein
VASVGEHQLWSLAEVSRSSRLVDRHIEWRVVSLIAIAWHTYAYGTNYHSESLDVLDNETLSSFRGGFFSRGGMVGRAMRLELF